MRGGLAKPAVMALAALAALATVACGETGGQASSASSPSSAKSSPATVKAAGPCANDYFPVVKGAMWSYGRTTSATGAVAEITSVISDVGAADFKVLSTIGQRSAETAWSCDSNGLRDGGTGIVGSLLSGPTGTATVTVRDNSGVTVPKKIQAGDAWNQTTDMDATVHGVAFVTHVATDFKAMDLEAITVPAGTFTAMRVSVAMSIHYTQDGYPVSGSYNGFGWWVAGIGKVKAAGSISLAGVAFDSGDVLDSYSIPKP